jgi:hypothetical protein
MRASEWIQIIVALVFTAAAWARPVSALRRNTVTLLAIIVILVVTVVRLITSVIPPLAGSVMRDWLPGALFLLPYWQTGQLIRATDNSVAEKLAQLDRTLFVRQPTKNSGRSFGRIVTVAAEIAYALVYPLVPLGLGVLYLAGLRRDADCYWIVILVATYSCYVTTPFVPALPPRLRAQEQQPGPKPAVKRLNHWIIRQITGNSTVQAA